jgi:hypothetical protein
VPSTTTPLVLAIADLSGPAESASTSYMRETRIDIAPFVPALKGLVAGGIDARGPLPADAAFFVAGRGVYDLIVAMDDGQGHLVEIGSKIEGLRHSVQMSVGDRLDVRQALLGEGRRTP